MAARAPELKEVSFIFNPTLAWQTLFSSSHFFSSSCNHLHWRSSGRRLCACLLSGLVSTLGPCASSQSCLAARLASGPMEARAGRLHERPAAPGPILAFPFALGASGRASQRRRSSSCCCRLSTAQNSAPKVRVIFPLFGPVDGGCCCCRCFVTKFHTTKPPPVIPRARGWETMMAPALDERQTGSVAAAAELTGAMRSVLVSYGLAYYRAIDGSIGRPAGERTRSPRLIGRRELGSGGPTGERRRR